MRHLRDVHVQLNQGKKVELYQNNIYATLTWAWLTWAKQNQTMTENKTYRVLITETESFYVDVTAQDAQEACQKVRDGINRDTNPMIPEVDDTYYEGYQVQDAIEMVGDDLEMTNPQE